MYSAECRSLPLAVREDAINILLERFSATNKTKDNAQIIRRLFGVASGAQHCFHSRQDVDTNSPVMIGYRCAVAIGHKGQCVGVACFRHVAPRRQADDKKFTELLLLAVRSDQERRRIGSHLFEFLQAEAHARGSKQLLVISNGHAFWERPQLRLHSELSTREKEPVRWHWSSRSLSPPPPPPHTHNKPLPRAPAPLSYTPPPRVTVCDSSQRCNNHQRGPRLHIHALALRRSLRSSFHGTLAFMCDAVTCKI